MGRVGRLLSFFKVTKGNAKTYDAKVNLAANINTTVDHFSSPGDDSQPLPDDYCALVVQTGEGRMSGVGYIDPNNLQKSNAGDKRIYARHSNGDEIIELWLKNDGSAILSNGTGSIQLLANGTVNINGVTIDTSGNIVSPTSVSAPSAIINGKELAEHTHITGTTGNPTGPNQ